MIGDDKYTEFVRRMRVKWGHESICATHLEYIASYAQRVKCHVSTEFEIYYTTNHRHNIEYVNDVLTIKQYI